MVKIPRWLPPVLYAGLTLVLFRSFVFSSGMLYGSDTESLGYMARAFYADAVRTEGFPLWNPFILGGTPFLDALSGGDSLYPLSAPLLFLLEPYRALGWKLVLHVFLAGVFMHMWIRTLGLSRAAALVAGIAYTMAPFMVSLVINGQDGKIFVTALTPLLFWATERALSRRGAVDYCGLAGVIGLVILTTHFQLAYFLFGATGAYAIFRCVQLFRVEGAEVAEGAGGARVAVGAFGAFLLAAVLGAGISAVQLLPAADYVVESSRRTATTTESDSPEAAIAYSSSWSLHPEEAVSLLVPEFVGVTTGDAAWASGTYWGRNSFKSNHEYMGIVVLLLAGLSFFGTPRKGLRWFFVGLGAVALFFGLGTHTPVWRILYEVLPGISLFRAPSVTIFLVGFSAVTLAAFGVERLIALAEDRNEEAWKKPTWYLTGVVGLLTVLLLAAASGGLFSFWTGVVYPEIVAAKFAALGTARPFVVRGFFIAVVLALLVGALIAGLRAGKVLPQHAVAALCLLVAADLYRVDEAFIITNDFEAFNQPGPLIELVRDESAPSDPGRILSLVHRGQDVRPGQFGLELAGGHHPNDLARYRELIGMQGSDVPLNLITSPNVLRLLNVRYILWPAWQLGRPSDRLPSDVVAILEAMTGTQTRDGRPYELLFRVSSLPRARLVGRPVVLPDDRAVEHILSDDFDPDTEVVLAAEPRQSYSADSTSGSVTWTLRQNNRQALRVRADQPAILVVADNWFDAWTATIDGEDAPVLRANHTLRAVEIPPGDHEVVFRYESDLIRNSLVLSLASLLLVTGTAAGSLAMRRRSDGAGEKEKEEEED